MDGNFIRPPQLPQQVTVVNMPGSTGDFFKIVKRQYDGLQKELNADEALIMLYDSAVGERVYVDTVVLSPEADTLVFQGWDRDNNFCQVVAQSYSVPLLFKIIKREDPSAERRPIGFSVVGEDEEDEGEDE
jgi:hypothetical protein